MMIDLPKIGMIALTRPDGLVFLVRCPSIELIETAANLLGAGNAGARVQIGGVDRFVMESPGEIAEKIGALL